jgi:hypothetical protein
VLKRMSLIFICSLIFLTSCDKYSFIKAKPSGDVETGPKGQLNIEKLEKFYNDFKEKNKGELRIVRYTDEGDPIINDLIYDGNIISYTIDNSGDKWGGKDKGKKSTQCNGLNKLIGPRAETYGTEYTLSECKSDIGYSYPIKKEYFLFFVEKK